MYLEESLQHYLDDLASAQPAPGGGSTAALSGAMGAALVSMVCRITLGKPAYVNVQPEIESVLSQTENMRKRFQQLMQEDIEAYGNLSASYKLPRETDEERRYRSSEIQKQLVEAALVPLEVVENAARLMTPCQRIAEISSSNILSDVETAAILASSAGKGAAFMVRINVHAIKNATVAAELEARLQTALATIVEGVDRVHKIVEERM